MDVVGKPDGTVVMVPTSEEAAALGTELGQLLEWFGTALTALAHLRNGSTDDFGRTTWQYLLRDLEHHLPSRLDGIRNALIREHVGAGGSHGELAEAMCVPRSTAQYRRNRVLSGPPDVWEEWAVSGRRPAPPTAARPPAP